LRSTSQKQPSISSQRTNGNQSAAQSALGAEPPAHITESPFVMAQRAQIDSTFGSAIQRHTKNKTGLPTQLQSGVEALSGMSMDAVRVHYNSAKPAQLNAHAYAQGTDIHVAPGQERHLPHEAWHVVQQAQGRVRPTMQMKSGALISDDHGLEKEADVMGARGLRGPYTSKPSAVAQAAGGFGILQLKGVGGSKIAFEGRTDPISQQIIVEGIGLLKDAWKEARALRQAQKDKISRDMAAYDKAVKEKDNDTIQRLEEENFVRSKFTLRNHPQPQSGGQLRLRKAQTSQLLETNRQDIETERTRLQNLIANDRFGKDFANLEKNEKGQVGMQVNREPTLTNLTGQTAVLRQNDQTSDRDIIAAKKTTGLTQVYFDSLTSQIPDEDELLQESAAFKGKQLSLADNKVTYHHHTGDVVIADLRKGLEAYAESKAPAPKNQVRPVFHKKGLEDLTTRDGGPKEYVKDKRGTMTRRYAYVEKNYYQMMEFFMVEHMTGRFQQYMSAGANRKPGIHKITTAMIRNVPTPPSPQLSDTQVAVAHQMYGSLPEQRGVSLTSTPKTGVTYANTGGNFRTKDGFKLKIDLARVPEDVLFLNHYAEGGVSNMPVKDYSVNQTHKPVPYNYKYEESAGHARELFLEHISPEWVVEIEHHAEGGFNSLTGKRTIVSEKSAVNILEVAKKAFGGKEFEGGFEAGLNGKEGALNLQANPDFIKGKATGSMVVRGFNKGKDVLEDKKDKADDSVAFTEIMEDPVIQDEMSPFHIGYAQGRTGQRMVDSLLEYRALLNNTMEVKGPGKTPDTFSLLQDTQKLVIRSTKHRQMGGSAVRIVTVPNDELATAAVITAEDEGKFEVTLKKKSGDYMVTLEEAEADRFAASLRKCIDISARNMGTQDTDGTDRSLSFDPTNLKISSYKKNQHTAPVFKKHDIPITSITTVEFEWADGALDVNIHHRTGSYNMVLAPAEAARVRNLLLQNGLRPQIVGKIPEKL
jgi:Domain of unknown function (DUF4157)